MSTLQYFGVPTGSGEGRGGILQPKTKWKFRVIVTNFGVPTSSIALTQQVMTVGRPQVNFNSQAVHSYNSIAYYGGKPEWQSVSMSVRDDITNSIAVLVDAQLQRQMNFIEETSTDAAANYKFQMSVETMDGSDDGVLEEWYYEGCFLEQVNMDSFDYASSDPMHIDMTIRYDNVTSALMPISPILTNGNYLIG